jgi:DNA-binding MarR family transcriptional regulator
MPRTAAEVDRALVEEIMTFHRATGMRTRRLLAESGVPFARIACLWKLELSGEVPSTVLARDLGVRAPTLTGLIDPLEAQGLVRRRPSPKDRRVTLIGFTPAGRRFIGKFQAEIVREWTELLAGVPANRKRAWTELLRSLGELAQVGIPEVEDR